MATNPDLTEDRRAALLTWLTANGIHPRNIPANGDLTIETTEQGRVILYEAFVRDERGAILLNDRGTGPARVFRRTPLVVDPPDGWEPYEKPTREQLAETVDAGYRERAHLVALLAALTDHAVIAYATDVDEPGWQIVYLTLGGRQASWHIAPRDAELFTHVERVDIADPRARWDGHTTEAKYTWIAEWTAELAQRCGPACAEQQTETGRCETARNR
ncbi:hypothetical protein [Streptomyces sp. NPDC001781]